MKILTTTLVAAMSVMALSDSAHAVRPQPFNWKDWEYIKLSESHYVMPSGEVRLADITYRVRRDDSNFGHRHENWYWRTGFLDFHKIGSAHYARRQKKKDFVKNAKKWPHRKSDGIREMSSKDVRRGKNSFGSFWYVLTSDSVQSCFFYFQQLAHRGGAGYEDALDAAGGFINGVDCRSADDVSTAAHEKGMLHYFSGLRRRTAQDNRLATKQTQSPATTAVPDVTGRAQQALDEPRFNDVVVDKKLIDERGTIVTVHSDGKIRGLTWNRADRIRGSWWFEGGYFCREVRVGSRPKSTDCQVVTFDGDSKVTVIRERGKGEKVEYEIK